MGAVGAAGAAAGGVAAGGVAMLGWLAATGAAGGAEAAGVVVFVEPLVDGSGAAVAELPDAPAATGFAGAVAAGGGG